MSIVVVVTAFPLPEHRAEVIAAFEAAIARVHGEPGAPDPVAAGGRPGQRDAVPGPALIRRTGLPARRAPVHRRGNHRGIRRRPRACPALPAAADAPRK